MRLILVVLLSLIMLQCNSRSAQDQGSSHTPISDLNPIYSQYCASCHGPKLQKFKDSDWKNKYNLQSVSQIIKEGIADKGMPAFGEVLSEEQRAELADFILNYSYNEENETSDGKGNDIKTELVAEGLDIPWGMEFLPKGEMLIAERHGRLTRLSQDGNLIEIDGLPDIRAKGQGGLMDLKLHPDYSSNGWIYISYVYYDENDNSKGNTAIMRARLNNNRIVDKEIIFKAVPTVSTAHHFGCRMVLDNEGFLWFGVGDRGRRDDFPQRLDNANGKIHRIHDDGRIPVDNPFVDNPNAIHSIFSYGHRNPQGIAMHPGTGEIWEHEHGPKGGDEINLIQKATNYGWPVISYGVNYSGTKFTELTEKEGMAQPIHYYVPSIAPCGMTFVTGDKYPYWEGSILIGSLSFRYLERIKFKDGVVVEQEKLLENMDSRVRDVRMGPDGFIYVALEGPGRILKILP